MSIKSEALQELVQGLFPGARVQRVARLGEEQAGDITEKGAGYGVPLRLTIEDAAGRSRDLVWHTASANAFGHDRRSDRAQEMLLAFDTFGRVPGQVRAVDVGAVTRDGRLISLGQSDELYLITEYAPGTLYAGDLRRMAHDKARQAGDEQRCDLLADYLAALHRRPLPADVDRGVAYTRAIRDLVGHGEGIFGIVDGYPDDVPGAPPARLRALEERCLDWRWRLRGRDRRLAITHGDFHPFNILFDGDRLILLDASRGCLGDPADDVACLAINYVFFGLPGQAEDRAAWEQALGPLWHRFWQRYLAQSGDDEVLEVAPPFLAWRALVLANPVWYPALPAGCRGKLLDLAEQALAAGRLEPGRAEDLFA